MAEMPDVLAMAASIHCTDDLCLDGNDDPYDVEACITRDWDVKQANAILSDLRMRGWRLERDPAGTLPLGLEGKASRGMAATEAHILAIEAEARAAVLAEMRERVEGLGGPESCFCEADRDVDHSESDGGGPIYLRRAAVLALLSEETDHD